MGLESNLVSNKLEKLRRGAMIIREQGGGNPRVHPNGFIQLDLEPVEESWHASHKKGHSGAARRLHIWNPIDHELPHQKTVNEIHDHVFDMKSTVVRGVLIQRLYEFVVCGMRLSNSVLNGGSITSASFEVLPKTHELYQAIYGKKSDSRLEATGITGYLNQVGYFYIHNDESYTQPAFTLHDSDVGDNLVVTVMEKTAVHDGDAHVVVPLDSPPDNSFDRANAAPTEYLWDAIEASLR